MQKTSIPKYTPPQDIQEALKLQGAQRKRTAQLPKRSWVQRNPRTFQIGFITVSLLALFSKPLYDAFFAQSYKSIDYSDYSLRKKDNE